MRTEHADNLRLVILGLSKRGSNPVSLAMLYESMACTDEPAKARVRRQVNAMVRRQELIRVEDGVFQCNTQAVSKQHSEYYQRIWRALRSSKPGFSYQDVATVTRVSYTHVLRYCAWLKEEGYLEPYGMRGQARLFRATEKAQSTPNTPYPPRKIKDPFEQEKGLALGVVQAFLLRDPYQPAVQAKIIENCRAILARFEKEVQEVAHG
ncbi:hypothetical protein DFW101_0342 [Solidesulfovibrio carbinoliphilus subsp. oakridgensis]|uniref:Uncharacterized protein n=1 Tax=Solidesulfovibrio carbinoliphilus subsp. oakridgensis TaxID=694327 RepID=G7QD53_9BACT|nr:hypothetical protein [Solidesulfovibrio carbinoliphilus]EHJ46359.1 hypothetical protein DFW101_0342 [Solidesulfovibrio carbinoliphilus subsp. oakridgensis]